MAAIPPILLGLGILAAGPGGPELAQLREMLHDRQNPGGQSQAALLLVQHPANEAERVIRDGLRRVEDGELFAALAAAVRIRQDTRFGEELFAALVAGRSSGRQSAAETLAAVCDAPMVRRLGVLAGDSNQELTVRQTALWTLGRCGRKAAVPALLDALGSAYEALRRSAADALAELSGQAFGTDAARWNAWWQQCKEWPEEKWLERRLAYQVCRSRRLEGDLDRARAQVLRLQQQLYSRLPLAERVGHIQSLLDQEDPAVRLLAASWSVELVAGADAVRLKELAATLLRLSKDNVVEVQRAAVLGMGKVQSPGVLERLLALRSEGPPAVRSAAVRSLAAQARGTDAEATARQQRILPALQKALDDPAQEVVVEAAEELGVVGALEAGPVLTGLLRHSSEHVRQAAAQALERVADASVLDGLLVALDDPSAGVRFGLVGALARAAREGRGLQEDQSRRFLGRLEGLLRRDSDAGVRSRAATVLGEFAPPALLKPLWDCVLLGEDGRVQEKAWAAFVEILSRSRSLPLLQEWDKSLTASRQGPRRLQLLSEVAARWQRRPECQALAATTQEMLIEAYLELGKWGSAAPVVRDLLGRPAEEAETDRRLRWLLTVGEQALHEGNRSEALKAVQAARPYLPKAGGVAESFQRLEQAAQRE